MPQLHDSATRTTQVSEHRDDAARIFGLETEYGLSATHTEQPVEVASLAMMMFQPIVRRERSTNTYTTNGSRLYLDIGSHPEYATGEARTPWQALLQDLAGERIMRTMALDTQTRLRESHPQARIHLFRNNADNAGHSFGCHENYLVRRHVALPAIRESLLPFLITRQIYTGAGSYEHGEFRYTQRARFVDETVSSATTRSRPMINTRDEPHADPDAFRRLHVIIGDTNRSQWATFMKLATTHLVLSMIEYSSRTGTPSGLEQFTMADPIAANLAVNEDGPQANITLADGRIVQALAMQDTMLQLVTQFAHAHRDLLEESFDHESEYAVEYVLDQWQWVLSALANNDRTQLAQCVDWAAKQRLIDAASAAHTLSSSQIRQLDLDYHDIVNGRLFSALEQRGHMRVLASDDLIEYATTHAAPHTRAVLRAQCITAARHAPVQFTCDWTTLQVREPFRAQCMLLDPFSSTGDAQYQSLLERIKASAS